MKISGDLSWQHAVVVLSLVLCGCVPDDDTYDIVVIPKGLTHAHWQSIHRGALRAAEDLTAQGMPTRIIWDGPLRERDALAQIRIVDRRVSTLVDGIVLAPQHSQTMVAPVMRANAEGIPVVILDSDLESRDQYVKYVATDNYNGGWLAGKHLIEVLNADGKKAPRLVLLRYQVGSESTEQREQGFMDYINGYIKENGLDPDKIWLSTDKYAGATKDSAQREAAPLINRLRNRIDGIFCPNESSAEGVLDVLRNQGQLDKVRLMGFDASEPLLQAVGRDEVIGLILQDPYRMGYLSVWDLVHYLAGYDINDGGKDKVLGTGEYVITKDNLETPETVGLFDPAVQMERKIKAPVYKRND